ncbi:MULTISPECIES: DCC1-like thiol-disulfide oxidoreductase family protein [unclassified Moorena]|uniref:DCC1-like thiol-disulfide oxidoreductase family protein n=1 Tax=unclassified Moorena TaxID=2683338 RepID=UPI0013FFA061|nr:MULTISPECIES: DCC1-like thiol-disulfide oxidoreductase family protein [unclassified Moorena]NEO17474.1 DUF393 domain-containing protein [Moorena sp. SIO3E8]NEQ04306.1 DUF393 domain-containing protein [Moorena sp. SIO3F7]
MAQYPVQIQIVYDGDCPFCTEFVKLIKIREKIRSIDIVNARESPVLRDRLARSGYDLNEGMAVIIDDHDVLFGADAVTALAAWSEDMSTFKRIVFSIMRKKNIMRRIYPVLRFGRNITLFALGRKREFD